MLLLLQCEPTKLHCDNYSLLKYWGELSPPAPQKL